MGKTVNTVTTYQTYEREKLLRKGMILIRESLHICKIMEFLDGKLSKRSTLRWK